MLNVRYVQTDIQINKEVSDNRLHERRPDISLQIPPKPVGFGSMRGGKTLEHSQSFSRRIPSPGGFLRALSFKRKGNGTDGERSSLLSSDPKTTIDSHNDNFASAVSWQRCSSLPVTHASNLSPSVSMPASARTYNEQLNSHVGSLIFDESSLFINFKIGTLCFFAVSQVMGKLI